MKKRLLVITGVLLLSVFSGSNYAYAVNKLVNTSGISTLSQNTDSQLKFGGTINKIIAYDVDAGPGSDGAFTLDDDVIITGNLDATGFTEDGSDTLSNDISGNAATASDLVCTDCIGTTEIADSYLLNTGDAGTGTYSFDTVGIGTPTPDTLLHLYQSDAGINDIVNLLKLERISASKAGAVEVGFGSAIDFYLENDVGTQREAARIDVVWEDARDARELSSIRFNQSIAGTLTETMRLDDNGKVGISTSSPQSLLDIQGPAGSGTASAGILTLATKELTVIDGDQLGRINFNAPLESDGSDAILTAAAIWAEADATFSSTVNSGELVFATGTSEAATEKVRIDRDGLVGIGSATPATNLYIYESSSSTTPMLELEQASTGDPSILFDSDGNEFAIGIDSSDSDKFVISDSTALGTNNRLTIDSTGNTTLGGDVATAAGKGYSYNGTTVLNNMVSVLPDAQGTWPLELINQGSIVNGTLDLTSYTSATATAAFICNTTKDPDATVVDPTLASFQKYGLASPDWRDISLENHCSYGGYCTTCSWVQMDSSQRITYNFVRASTDTDSEFFVSVSAYLEPTT
ncbi:MAG: hypothetical protein PHU71_03000 [Candidatus Gracilibacteria bacterium]|nr:hypothetical protein [Candidatus Gracilibacteria bacterium]